MTYVGSNRTSIRNSGGGCRIFPPAIYRISVDREKLAIPRMVGI